MSTDHVPSHYPTLAPFTIAHVEAALGLLEILPDGATLFDASAVESLRAELTTVQAAQRRARDSHPTLDGYSEPDHDAANVLALPVPSHRAGLAVATSAEAARSLELKVGKLRTRALAALVEAGEDGLTDVQLEGLLGCRRPTGGNRRGELVKLGLVRRAPLARTRVVPGHRRAAVWVADLDRAIPALLELGYGVSTFTEAGIERRRVTPPAQLVDAG